MKDKKDKTILDASLLKSLRDKINSSKIFTEDINLKPKMNLIFSVLDRLDSCVKIINEHNLYKIKDDEALLAFFTSAAMLKDAIPLLFKEINMTYPFDAAEEPKSHEFFGKLYTTYHCLHKRNVCSESHEIDENQISCSILDCNTPSCPKWQDDLLGDCPTDDKFFEYLRSLIFAHPFNTDRPKFFLKNEKQYSPWIAKSNFVSKDKLIIRIYSNKFEGMLDLRIPFDNFHDYIKSRYNLLKDATIWADKQINMRKQKWAEEKINRNLDPVEILQEIKSTLKERFENSYSIDDAIAYLTCPLTDASNSCAVDKYREFVIGNIPALCDSIDSIDETSYENNSFTDALNPQPEKMHKMAHYQLEKIFSYLVNGERLDDMNSFNEHLHMYYQGNDIDSNAEWGVMQAMQFYEDLAKSYVCIKPTMPFTEIKLLVNCACYFEKLNQQEGIIGKALKLTLKEEESRSGNDSESTGLSIMLDKDASLSIRFADMSGKNAT